MNLRQQFDAELEELSDALITMGAMATEAIENAIKALETNNKELANQVIYGDRKIDDMERQIEQRCLRLLLKQQPVAGDLRKISAAIKMITDIERIGDGAADIAEISLNLDICSFPDVQKMVNKMCAVAKQMIIDSIDSYVHEDLELADKTRKCDDIVDEYFNKIRSELAKHLGKNEMEMDEIIDYLMVVKYLERLGDHAENICEWVEFYKTGVHKNERIV